MTKEAAGYILLGLGMIGLGTLCVVTLRLHYGAGREVGMLLVFGTGSLIYGLCLIFGPRLTR